MLIFINAFTWKVLKIVKIKEFIIWLPSANKHEGYPQGNRRGLFCTYQVPLLYSYTINASWQLIGLPFLPVPKMKNLNTRPAGSLDFPLPAGGGGV